MQYQINPSLKKIFHRKYTSFIYFSYKELFKRLLYKSKIRRLKRSKLEIKALKINRKSFSDKDLFLYQNQYTSFLNTIIVHKKRKWYIKHLMSHFHFKKHSLIIKKVTDPYFNDFSLNFFFTNSNN